MNFSGTPYYPEVTNCTGYIAYIDRVIMHKKIVKDGNEAAVAHFKIYIHVILDPLFFEYLRMTQCRSKNVALSIYYLMYMK
jgi:hypothetical protein